MLIYQEESFAIRGACFEVYNYHGCGFPESAYQQSLDLEFIARGIPAKPHPRLDLFYKGTKLDSFFVPDFICYDKIVVELKAISEIVSEHEAQLLSYLKATGHKLGLIVNFGHSPDLEIKRLVR